MIRLAFPFAAMIGAIIAAPAHADEESALALARQIVADAYPQEQRAEMFGGVADAMSAQMMNAVGADVPPGVRAIVEEETNRFLAEGKIVLTRHIPALMDSYAIAYRDEFSEAELRDIAEFVKTPTGSTFLMRSVKMIENPAFADANEAYISEIMAMMPELRKRVESRVIAYLEAQDAG
ncbi:DUF2059 domain-containing protein [uncultured Croceicoccus sp.]|uniref:DUF2059 domain-containing protein n=1 Tax=uncultured Croceicoccus sp. TaxID=1295329 RepID=UPI0026116B4C|nr:DUF2059 domain-containing protein [uncultured Croceicoccus sp.]